MEADSLLNDEKSHDQEHASHMGTASCPQVKVDQQPHGQTPEVPEHVQDLFQ